MQEQEFDRYLRTALGNVVAANESGDHWTSKLRALDACLHRLTDNLTDATDALTAAFALDVHSRMAAASLLALAGAMDETYPVARSALESAMYMCLLRDNVDVRARWFTRDEDDGSRRRLRADITTSTLVSAVQKLDAGVAAIARRQYEESITWGAHPNVGSIAGSMKITETESQTEFVRSFLGGHDVEIAAGRKHIVVTGITVIEIIALVIPEVAKRLGVPALVYSLKCDV